MQGPFRDLSNLNVINNAGPGCSRPGEGDPRLSEGYSSEGSTTHFPSKCPTKRDITV